jgi:uncharacterized protein (DUF983 family)
VKDLEWDPYTVECPHCGAKQGDLWEYSFNGEAQVSCVSCDEDYTLHRMVTVEYASSIDGKESA